ncbi:putative metallophosphoesterase [Paenibacillus agaridevorans]|uniref:Putative metallophosphoesterase n=1 Tax=Paenibacillus agaridevorans TaxID=171404 RepID=A0A2R5F173_9BACL|nr:metallophosphoesterase [Paenibacillus agaridevorans]GBG11188.1 putative metallophosphoesterase [Paenibacillus agaridevorans]
MRINSGKQKLSNQGVAKRAVLLPILVFLLIAMSLAPTASADPVVDGKFTIAIIPDTQNEVEYSAPVQGEWFKNRTQYLANNKNNLDLRFVIHTGDVANWPAYDPDQLPIASDAIAVLDNVNIRSQLSIGNHDTAAVYIGGSAVPGGNIPALVRDTTAFNAAFPVSRYPGIVTFEANKVDNAYQTFEAEGKKWLVLTLELWPRTAAVNWAKGVVENHPDYNVIIQTHSYLTGSGNIEQSNGGYGANSPQYVYDNLVKLYPNIKFVFSGHTGLAAKREDTGVNGNKIVSIVGAFHSSTNNPVQLLEIDAVNGTASTRFYAPLDGYEWTQYNWTFSGLNFVPPSSTPTYLMYEEFNSQADGVAPANWILNTSGGTATVQSFPSVSEKSMRLQKLGTTGYAAGMKKFTSQTSGIVTYDTWVLPQETAGIKQIMVRNYDALKIASIVAFENGNIKVNAWTNVQTFVANQWYHIVVKLNQNNKTFEVFVDDVSRGTFNYYHSDTNDLGEMLFSIPPDYTGTFFVSDIRVSK